jgi:hypothetical protein
MASLTCLKLGVSPTYSHIKQLSSCSKLMAVDCNGALASGLGAGGGWII